MWFALPETRSFRNVGGKFLTQSSLVVVKNTLGVKRGPEQGQVAVCLPEKARPSGSQEANRGFGRRLTENQEPEGPF